MKSLLEQLPSIVAEGKREAERVMERAESNYRLGLQTRELVVPSRDTNIEDLFKNKKAQTKQDEHPNRLIYGDNLLVYQVADDNDRCSRKKQPPANLMYKDKGGDFKDLKKPICQ